MGWRPTNPGVRPIMRASAAATQPDANGPPNESSSERVRKIGESVLVRRDVDFIRVPERVLDELVGNLSGRGSPEAQGARHPPGAVPAARCHEGNRRSHDECSRQVLRTAKPVGMHPEKLRHQPTAT
jgi:hypothetical protein